MISLVDDDVELLKAMTKVLEKEGHQVAANTDAQTALNQIRKTPQQFKLVITDVSMPGMKGMELLANLKNEFPNIPVIIITAFGEWDQYMRAMQVGACDYISKPLEKNEFLKTVSRAICGHLKPCKNQKMETDTDSKHTLDN